MGRFKRKVRREVKANRQPQPEIADATLRLINPFILAPRERWVSADKGWVLLKESPR